MPDSFYGGKAGYSFVITRSFETVEEMIEQFQKGPAFTEVKYGEYVIIDTVDKNNPDNGSIYQRTANYTDKDTGGAVLLGSIVGPAGPAPHIHIEDY
jgi:hypothetical protein